MIIYIDITQLEKQRVNTGIQRLVKEFLQRALCSDSKTQYKIVKYNLKIKKMQLLQNDEVQLFIQDIKNFKFTKKETIDIESIKSKKTTILFDIDSPWNNPYKRNILYPILKNNGFIIYNFIYDMIPILLPQFVQNITIENFKPYIKTVCKYSDMVICDSSSAQKDFLKYKSSLGIKRNISTKVTPLGSSFLSHKNHLIEANYKDILNKKYILFVGTLEPRKNQEDVLDAFESISKKHAELNLVFIGIKGWKVDALIQRIESHPLKDERLFWFNNIDDDTLYHFYKNAFIVTYLSKYEGYGLPIVESLKHGNITITSNNSSMPEVGLTFADYVDDNNLKQLVSIICKYCENKELYNKKKKDIKENFNPISWDQFSNLIFQIIDNHKLKQEKQMNLNNLKNIIKSIPFLGWLTRWSYNLLKLNNLKHTVYQQQKQIKKQQKQIDKLIAQNSLSEVFDSKQAQEIFLDIKKSTK